MSLLLQAGANVRSPATTGVFLGEEGEEKKREGEGGGKKRVIGAENRFLYDM